MEPGISSSARSVLFCTTFLILIHPRASSFQGSSASKVKITSQFTVNKIKAGSTFNVELLLVVANQWHINSSTPTYDFLLGTELQLQPKEGITLAEVKYPEGKNVKLGFADKPLNVYEGKSSIFLTLKLAENYKTGRDTLRANVRVQACNDLVCLAPSTIDVVIPIEVVGSRKKGK